MMDKRNWNEPEIYPYNLLREIGIIGEMAGEKAADNLRSVMYCESGKNGITRRQCRILELYYAFGKSPAEIASHLQISVNRVKWERSKGLRCLRKKRLEIALGKVFRPDYEFELLIQDELMHDLSNHDLDGILPDEKPELVREGLLFPENALPPSDCYTTLFIVKKPEKGARRMWPVKTHLIPVEDLELSVRSFNCLKRAGVNTVGDIASLLSEGGVPRLLKLRNLGKKSADEIIRKLDELGVTYHI